MYFVLLWHFKNAKISVVFAAVIYSCNCMEYASPLPLNTVLPVNKKHAHTDTRTLTHTHTRAHTHAHTCTPTSARTHRRARTHATDTYSYVYTVAGLGVGFMGRSPGTSTCLGGFEWVGGCVRVGYWVCLGG